MKKREVLDLFLGLRSVQALRGPKFCYATARSRSAIKSIVEDLQTAGKSSPKYAEYEKKRIKLCKKFCQKDSEGNSVTAGGSFAGLDNNGAFDAELETLNEEYAAEISEREKEIEEYNTMLDEEVEVKLHKVRLRDLPKDINAGQTAAIFEMIFPCDDVDKELEEEKEEKK